MIYFIKFLKVLDFTTTIKMSSEVINIIATVTTIEILLANYRIIIRTIWR